MTNKHKGSSFDEFLEEERLLEEAELVAVKRVIAFQLEKAMKKKRLTKIQLAAKMHTSRSALDRILDPTNTAITLNSLVKVAYALGKKTEVRFVDE